MYENKLKTKLLDILIKNVTFEIEKISLKLWTVQN